MDVREKLVELIRNAHKKCKTRKTCQECEQYGNGSNCVYLLMADELIANGVTVQEWISVDDRLPEEGEYVLCVLKGFNYGGKIQVCKFVPADKFKDKPYFEHFRNGFPSVTHWMPLPEPPKGE